MFRSVQTRLTVLCIVLAVIPLTFIGALLAWQGYQLQQQYALNLERQVTQRASLQIGSFITNVADKLSLAIQTADIRDASQDAKERLLSQIILETSVFDELAFLDHSGHEEVRV